MAMTIFSKWMLNFSHDPGNDLPRLYTKRLCQRGLRRSYRFTLCDGCQCGELAHGSRIDELLMLRIYVRFVTGVPIHDTTAGFKCYRRRVLETIDLDAIRFKGYAFQIEMKFTGSTSSVSRLRKSLSSLSTVSWVRAK